MSLRRVGSIFDRKIKRVFNETKYANPTARTSESASHLSFYSYNDASWGRLVFFLGVSMAGFMAYYDAGWFHETFGHLPGPKIYDNIDGALGSEERRLNNLLLEREHEEHRLHAWMEVFKSYNT